MNQQMRRCKQCGLLKEIDQYRQYTYAKKAGTKGRYTTCHACENINCKYRRAKELIARKPNCEITDTEYRLWQQAWLIIEKTEKLYAVLEANGFHVTGRTPIPLDDATKDIDALMSFYENDGKTTEPEIKDLPNDLIEWLNTTMNEWREKELTPEYLQETIYESLKAKYRPQIGFDSMKGLPVFDDKYKSALNQILRKFDEYEETFAVEDESNDSSQV